MTEWDLDAIPKSLLTTHNTKTMKGEKKGYLTAIMHLAPHTASGISNVCTHATAGCSYACLNTSGQGGMGLDENGLNRVQAARIRRTRFLKRHKDIFMTMLVTEITEFEHKARQKGLIPVVRLNGTSDIPWEKVKNNEGKTLMELYPEVQFYDYTKYPPSKRGPLPPNYHLTFSLAEDNDEIAVDALSNNMNVAVVLKLRPSEEIPTELYFHDKLYPVVDGDKNDLRFLDDINGGIVALRAKGRAKKDETGFVRDVI